MAGPPACRISLIVPTRGRCASLARLLDSLAGQHGVPFEVIVVDQNADDRLGALLSGDWAFPLRHVRRPGETGASRARNVGWRLARAPILLFPDDDCWYPPGFLARGLALMASRRADILTGRSTDPAGRTINGRYAAQAGPIRRHGVWTRQIEWIALFRRDLVARLGGYDETVGVGAETPWQAGEGPDLILRAIAAGAATWYDPAFIAYHDELPARRPDGAMVAKGRAYGRGMGRVLRQRGFPAISLLYWCARPLAAWGSAVLRRDPRRTRYCRAVLLGRLEGWRGAVPRGE